MNDLIEDVIQQCSCNLAFAPRPHAKVGARPPSTEPQANISIDVVHLGGKNFIHAVDECTSWSEVGHISSKAMDVQIRVLYRMQHLRHGPPKTIRCDNEYNNKDFQAFCATNETQLIPVAADDHEANGLVENANRTLRSFYDRFRCCDKKSTAEAVVAEAVYGKNISLGSRNVSAFELLYSRRPPLLPALRDHLPPPMSIEENSKNVARRRVNKMLRTQVRKQQEINVGDTVAIWRDASGWIAPARVTKITPYYYEVTHNGRVKTSGINRTKLIINRNDDNSTAEENQRTAITFYISDYDEEDPLADQPEDEDDLPDDGADHPDNDGGTTDQPDTSTEPFRHTAHRIPRRAVSYTHQTLPTILLV